MKLQLNWLGQGFRFEGQEENGITVQIDGNRQTGPSPMGMLLHAVAACSAIDILDILGKMQQHVTGLTVEVEAVRAEGDYPRVWKEIRLHYQVTGEVSPDRAQRAMDLSLGKYCSVSAMLDSDAIISGSISVKS